MFLYIVAFYGEYVVDSIFTSKDKAVAYATSEYNKIITNGITPRIGIEVYNADVEGGFLKTLTYDGKERS